MHGVGVGVGAYVCGSGAVVKSPPTASSDLYPNNSSYATQPHVRICMRWRGRSEDASAGTVVSMIGDRVLDSKRTRPHTLVVCCVDNRRVSYAYRWNDTRPLA